MENIYFEIILEQPKADPRTVLSHKINYMETSSDHIQNFYRNSINKKTSETTTSKTNCDKLKNIYKIKIKAEKTKCLITNPLMSSSPSPSIPSFLLLSTTTILSPSSSSSQPLSSSLLSTNLVKFLKSCHFKSSFNNNLCKIQKTNLIFFLLFICCAIFLQTAQAVSVHRVTTSGRKLILHTNIHRERYHQKLLEERRQHNQHQMQVQLQLQEQQKHLQLQQLKQSQSQKYLLHQYMQKQQQQQQQQHQRQQQHQQVQKNHIFSPIHQLRRHPQPQQSHHRHHLNQRAAPLASTAAHRQQQQQQQYKMSYCNGNKVYHDLHQQMNASMLYIKQLCTNYLRDRGNQTYESMSETWKLISLETKNPYRKPVSIENELHKQIHEFYLNLHNFDQLIDRASNDTYENKTIIEHGEEISIDKIIKFFQSVKAEIKFNMKEADNLMEFLDIEKPNIKDNQIEFNDNMGRRIRDFLIIKNLIEEFERVLQLVQNYCENNNEK